MKKYVKANDQKPVYMDREREAPSQKPRNKVTSAGLVLLMAVYLSTPFTAVAAPEINLTGNSRNIPDGALTPGLSDHTDFASTTVAKGSIEKTYTIENTGNTGLTLIRGAAVFAEQTTPETHPLHYGHTAGRWSAPAFVDIDNDGDHDVFMGNYSGKIYYYKNTGSSVLPDFTEQTGTDNPLAGLNIGVHSAPVFIDIDHDGDYDAFIGENAGKINYYKNTGSAAMPVFTKRSGIDNPLDGVDVGTDSAPDFVDIDNDGDYDVFIGERGGVINYYINTGASAIPVFVEQIGDKNPFNGEDIGSNSQLKFIDIDNDGDYDAFIGEMGSTINYYKNTGSNTAPVFTRQTGGDNPLDFSFDRYTSPDFVDIDNDGDYDAFIGCNVGNLFYYKNTGSNINAVYSIQTGINHPLYSVFFDIDTAPISVDIDDDGDYDVFIGESSGTIDYFKNVGSNVSPDYSRQTGGDNPMSSIDAGDYSRPAFIDIDNDGDRDAFIGSKNGLNYYKKNYNKNN